MKKKIMSLKRIIRCNIDMLPENMDPMALASWKVICADRKHEFREVLRCFLSFIKPNITQINPK